MFLSASRSLTHGTIMSMEMSRAMSNRVTHPHMPLQPLMQVTSLRNVNRNPLTVLGLFGVDVIPGQRPEGSVQRVNLVGIFLPRFARPVD
jgi:hypothetical protein